MLRKEQCTAMHTSLHTPLESHTRTRTDQPRCAPGSELQLGGGLASAEEASADLACTIRAIVSVAQAGCNKLRSQLQENGHTQDTCMDDTACCRTPDGRLCAAMHTESIRAAGFSKVRMVTACCSVELSD